MAGTPPTAPGCSSPSVQPGTEHCRDPGAGSALAIPSQPLPGNNSSLPRSHPTPLCSHSLGAVPAALGNCLSPGFLQLLQALQGHPELSPKLLLCRLNNPSCASLSSQQSCSILCSSCCPLRSLCSVGHSAEGPMALSLGLWHCPFPTGAKLQGKKDFPEEKTKTWQGCEG